MADNRTMASCSRPPKGYEDAIVIPEINANFELKHGLINLVQNKQFFGHDKEDPHAHIRYFNKITSTMRFSDIPSTSIKLMLFPFSLEGSARIWLEKEPPRSILTWDDLEFFSEAWERFKELLRACPHYGFTELTQVDTFYNCLNENEQDSLNAAAGGNLLSKTTREALNIIENKSKVCYSRNRSNASRMNATSSRTDERIDKLADQLSTLVKIVSKKVVTPALVKAVEETCITCGGAHSWYNCPATDKNQASVCTTTASTSGTLPSNTIPNPKGEMKAITTRSGVAYEGPSIPTNPSPKKVVERETEETTDKEQTNFQGSTAQIPPPVIPISIPEPDVPKTLPKTTPILESDIPKSLPKPNIPYPSRRDDQKSRDKASNQMEKIFQIFQDLRFDISFADALLLMPRFAPTIKSLLMNKEKLLELAKIPLNENCSAMLLKKLPEKLGDPGKFLIPCNFPGMDFPVNYPPQETNKEILHAREDLIEAIQAFLKEKSTREKGDGSSKFDSILGFFMIDDEEVRDNFLKDVYTFLRKFSRIPFGVTPKVILIAWESFGKIKDALMDKQYQQEDIQELISKLLKDVRNYTVIWRRPKVITPDEPSEEPEDPLIMGEEELITIPEKENLGLRTSSQSQVDLRVFPTIFVIILMLNFLLSQNIPITSPKFDFLSEEFAGELAPIPPGMDEDEFDEEEDDCYDHDTSSDDDSYENIEYVEASPLYLEYDSLEEVNEDQEEKEFDLEDIFQIQDVILHEKLLNVHHLITNIKSLKNNPTPDHVFKSPSSVLISVTDSGSDHTEETRGGSTTTHVNNSLPEYDSFLFEVEPNQGGLSGIVISDNSNNPLLEFPEFESFHFNFDPSFPRPPSEPSDVEISLIIETDTPVINNVDELNEDECFYPGGDEIDIGDDNSFTFVTWTLLPYLTYPEVSLLLSSTKNKDTIFDPSIST
ncbi:hypothetical protein Tco_0012295 [Tanacetum coccineum]